MNDKAKIHLSKFEKELIINKEWILTKRQIIDKIYALFTTTRHDYEQVLLKKNNFFSSLIHQPGKISKGENYEGLPYVMLDYPASFSKEKITAIRTMFWWGNFFSVTLHLAGKEYLLKEKFLFQNNFLRENNFYICINENQWDHGFEPSNFMHVSAIDQEIAEKIINKDFIKISRKMDVSEWDEIPDFLMDTFNAIVTYMSVSFPNDEITL